MQEERAGATFDYFWFTIPAGLEQFSYSLGLQTDGTLENNVDLYVGLKDGRYPTNLDYEIKSDMNGADFITISSASKIWQENGWEYS